MTKYKKILLAISLFVVVLVFVLGYLIFLLFEEKKSPKQKTVASTELSVDEQLLIERDDSNVDEQLVIDDMDDVNRKRLEEGSYMQPQEGDIDYDSIEEMERAGAEYINQKESLSEERKTTEETSTDDTEAGAEESTQN